MGVTTGVARPRTRVTELAVKLVTQTLPEPSMASPWGDWRPVWPTTTGSMAVWLEGW